MWREKDVQAEGYKLSRKARIKPSNTFSVSTTTPKNLQPTT